MNIGFDARLYQKGLGLGRYVEQLLACYDAMDLSPHTLTVFLSREGITRFTPQNPAIRTVCAPYPWYSWREQILFPRLLARHHLDVVHFPHFNVPIWYRRSYIVTIHDLILLKMPRSARLAASTHIPMVYDFKYAAYRYALNKAASRAYKIIVPTDYVRDDIVRLLGAKKESVIRIYEAASSLPKESHDLEVTINAPYVLYVGNAYPHKNLGLLVSMAALIRQQSLDLKIVLVGQDDFFSQSLREDIQKQGLSNIIIHKGFVDDAQLSSLYHHALCYVFPSREEGFGLPGLEAMAHGLPVIASSSSCLPEVYGSAALYLPPDDPKVWLEQIQALRYDDVLRDTMVSSGIRRVNDFSWNNTASQTWDVLTSL